jgi:FlaA1/EpsC-like NDP-sugar epimerase
MIERRGQPGEPPGARRTTVNGTAVRREAPRWLHKHVQMLALLDALAAAAATLASKALAFGMGSNADLHVRSVHVPYVAFILVSVPTWLALLATSRCYDAGPFGTGNGEARRVVSAGAHFVAVMAVAYYLLHIQNLGRAFLAAIVPFAIAFTLLGRALARYRLRLQRVRGHATRRTLVMGLPRNTSLLLDHLAVHPYTGIAPAQVAVPGGAAQLQTESSTASLHVTDALSDVTEVLRALTATRADLLIVTGGMSGSELRKLTWRLEGTGVAVMVAPTVAGLAGPQLDVRPVAGLPLLYVDHARLGLRPVTPVRPTPPPPPPPPPAPSASTPPASATSPDPVTPVPAAEPPV